MNILTGIFGVITNIVKQLIGKPVIVFVLLIIVAGVAIYNYSQYRNTKQELSKLKTDPMSALSEETKKLVKMVGNLVVLPSESPTIATVTDITKVKSQSFFANAANGDKVLIYTGARKAYLYRPSINKVIEVAPVNIGTSATGVAGTSTEKNKKIRVALYNGTTTIGLTNKTELDLKKELENLDVALKKNANKSDYKKTVVINLAGENKALAAQIAKIVNGEEGQLPEGEEKPEADILVILGKEDPTPNP